MQGDHIFSGLRPDAQQYGVLTFPSVMLLNACALSNCIFFFPFFLLNSLLPFLCEWVKEDDFYLFVFSRQSGFCTPSQELKVRCSRFNRNQQMVYKSHKWLEVRKGRIEKTSVDTDGVRWLVVGSRGMQTPCMSHSEETEGSSGAVESPVPLAGPQPTQQWKTTAA